MPAIISRSIRDLGYLEIVSVIASFDTDGHIKPLYVRVGEESLKVVSSWMKPSFLNTCAYNCKVDDHGILKPLVLTYHMNESVWTIPKYGLT